MSKTIIRITLLTSLAHLLFARKPNSNFLVQRGGSDFLEKENEISNDKLLIFNSENISWQLQQQQLMQLRSVYLSEILHKRGVSVPTVLSVSTLDSERAEPIGWECAMSTDEKPKSCLYSFDAPVDTKVVAPIISDEDVDEDSSRYQWISLSQLNRLRRTDPSKVEPMWHGKYAIRQAWFGDMEYSLLQHVGLKGWAVTTLLDHRVAFKSALISVAALLSIIFMPQIEFLINRFIVSGIFWRTYKTWGRFANAALPFKLLMVQMVWKFIAGRFDALEEIVRNYFIEVECTILEESVPISIGEGSVEEYDDFSFDADLEEDQNVEEAESHNYSDSDEVEDSSYDDEL